MAKKTRHHLEGAEGEEPKTDAPRNNSGTEFLTKEQFGRRVYRLMTEKGMRQSDLARASDLTRDSISQYVRGQQFPSPHSLGKLAKALEVEPDDLLPNHMHAAIREDSPTLEFKISSADSRKALLRVNRLVKPETAAKVVALLADDDTHETN